MGKRTFRSQKSKHFVLRIIHQHIYEQIQERNRWFVTAGAVSAYWWGGAFLETEEGYLLVRVDENNRFSWEYVDYGWSVGNNNN